MGSRLSSKSLRWPPENCSLRQHKEHLNSVSSEYIEFKIDKMRRSVLRAVESAKPLARAPRSVSRSFATVNEAGSKVMPKCWVLVWSDVLD